jgi:hypothetical protein
MYFMEAGESENLVMNDAEFTDAKWLTVKTAIEMEQAGDLPMLGPQFGIIKLLQDFPGN